MKKAKRTLSVILLLFYLAGFIGGITVMLAIPYFSHRQALIDLALKAADNYAATQEFNLHGYFGMNYLAYDLDGNCVKKVVSGFPDMAFLVDTDKYYRLTEKHGAFLYYDVIEVTMDVSSQHQLCLVSTAPIKSGDTTVGCFFLIRELRDVSVTLLVFVIVWNSIFLLLFLFFHILGKKELELDQRQRTYIASMNHELKSPITSIKALSETLLEGYVTDPEKQLFYYNTILKEANALEDTVLKILELSKLQSTAALYKKETVSADSVFSPVLERYRGLTSDIDIAFSAPDLKNTPLPKLYTAPALASRILDLLLHNASKFADELNGEIAVTFDVRKNSVVISVRDNGCGIPSEALPHIFERFYQAEHSHNKSGSGLGLSIVREIIDGLKEEIQVESEVGKGTVFSFTISSHPA